MPTTIISRVVTAALALTMPAFVAAQSTELATERTNARTTERTSGLEIRIPAGQLIGTGTQRNQLKDGKTTAAQLSWMFRSRFAVTGTFSWSRSKDVAEANAPKLDVFTSDLGFEARTAQRRGKAGFSLYAFAGVGGGVRSYNYRSLDVDATHNLAGYAALGSEARIKRVGVRLEARDYATGFKPLMKTGRSSTRNDVVVLATVTFNPRSGGSR